MTIEAARLSVVVDADTKDAEAGLDRMGGVVGKAGHALKTAALMGVGFAGAVGGASVGAAISLEDAFTPIGTLLGNTSPQFLALQDQLKAFMMNSPASADDIGMAAYTTLSAGITDTTKVMETLTASQQLSLAGLGDIGQANDLITSAMNSFSQEGLTADQAAKLLFGTIASGKTTAADLAQGFGSIAPLAAGAGVSFNDMLAATAALTSTGQSASVAYSGIRGALTAIISPTAEAAKTAETLGLNFSQAHLKAVGLPAFLDEVNTATGGNIETMGTLFGGVEGLNAVMSLTGPQSAAFAANLTGVGTAGANLADRAEEVSNTTSNSFAEMKNKAVVALSLLGDHIVDWAMPKIQELQEWITAHWPQIQAVAEEVFGAVSTFIGSVLVPALTAVVDVGKQVVGWIVDHWPEISETISQVVQRIVEAWETYGVPVMNAIIEVATQVVEWVQAHWGEISKTISSVMREVGDIIAAVLDIVQTLWENYGATIVDYVKGAFEAIMTIIQGAMDVVRGIIDTVMGLIHGDWSRVWDGIKEMFSGIWTAIGGIIDYGITYIKAALEMAWITIKSVADTAWEGIKTGIGNAIDGVVNFVKDLPGRAVSALSALGGLLLSAGTTAINFLWSGITGAWDAGYGFFTGLPGRVVSALSTWGTSLKDTASDAIRAMWGGIKEAWNYLADKTKFQLPSMHILGTDTDIGGGTFSLLPHLAGGGVLDRPTAFIGGEYPGAASNPEIVAPQSMIRDIFREEMQAISGGSGVHVEQNFFGITDTREMAVQSSNEIAWAMKTMAA